MAWYDEHPPAQQSTPWYEAQAPAQTMGTVEDVARSLGTGAVRGGAMMAGGVGDIRDLGGNAFNYLMNKAGVSPETTAKIGGAVRGAIGMTPAGPLMDIAPTSEQTLGFVNKAAQPFGGLHEPQTTAGEWAQTIGEFAPGAIVPGGGQASIGRRALQYAIAPALLSEGLGKWFEGSPLQPWAKAAGAVLGPSVAGRAITPAGMRPDRQAMADVLKGEGVTALTAGQRTGSPTLRWLEGSFGGGPAAERQGLADEQLTAAAMRRTGSGERLATPEALRENKQRLNADYNRILSGVVVRPDPQLGNDLGTVMNTYARALSGEQKAKVGEYASDIIDKFRQHGNAMPGDVYKQARSDINRIYKNNIGKDDDYAYAMKGLRDALHDSMRRSNPQVGDALDALDRQYAAQKAVSNVMGSAGGEGKSFGYLTPANIRQMATAGGGKEFYAEGQGMFTPLARSSTALMTPLRSSGTAERLAPFLTGIAGGALGHAAGGGDVLGTLISGVGSLGIPAAGGAALMSRPVQGYLGNQLLAHGPLRRELARALVAGNPMLQEQLGPQIGPLSLQGP